MWTKDKQTSKWIEEQGPTLHMSLFHHHSITSKANGIEPPDDDKMVIFDYPDGTQYIIKYGKLKEFATKEQENFINDDNQQPDSKTTE